MEFLTFALKQLFSKLRLLHTEDREEGRRKEEAAEEGREREGANGEKTICFQFRNV